MRAPIWLYRLRLGWLLGSRLLLLEHRGRNSGKRRRLVVEVIDHDRSTGVYWVAVGFGDRSDWYRNVKAEPRVWVTVGRKRFRAIATALSTEASKAVLLRYQKAHPVMARGLVRIFGHDSFEALTEKVPVVELRRSDELGWGLGSGTHSVQHRSAQEPAEGADQ